jgi:FkbH-like protein
LYARLHAFASRAAEIEGVRIAGPSRLAQASPPADRLNVKSELLSGTAYATAHASRVAEFLARLLAPVPPRKGLITDLDDTFWKGLVGELGAAGVAWDLDRRAHVHGLYQQLLAALAAEGVLIAVASKNDRANVDAALARRDLVLPGDVPFPVEVHWRAKSESVRAILQTWNIGASGAVFVDDSPMELDEVRSAHPEIECVLFPAHDPQAAYEVLFHLRDLFGKESVSEEDRLRPQSIRRNADLQELEQSAPDMDAFLRQAAATVHFSRDTPDPRAFELINKTNQFNLHGRRYTESEWVRYLSDPEVHQIVVSYRDKYGPLGKVAVLTGRNEAPRFRVENWVMSCRAFARRIEYHALSYVFDCFGAGELRFDFQRTPKNGPIQSFLEEVRCEPLADGVRLTRAAFEERCPPLVHRTEPEHAYDS